MNQQTLWQNGLEAGRVGQQNPLAQWISKKKLLADESANTLAECIGSSQNGSAKHIETGD